MRYTFARYETEYHEKMYRIYVTDSLKVAFGLSQRYADIFMQEETRSAEEIKESIKNKLRGTDEPI